MSAYIIHLMRTIPKKAFFCSLVVFICFLTIAPASLQVQASAPALDSAALDAYIQAQMSKHGLKGVSLAVVQGDQIVYSRGYGSAGSQPMTSQTYMFIGSLSKSFTALVIARLADQGRIDVAAPVQTYIPWFRVADEAASARITVNHLLHHISGLSESGFSVLLPDDASSEEATRALAQARLTAPPGTTFQYFNLGYTVLEYLIETVTGRPYPEILKEYVLDPIGMQSTTASPETLSGISQGYTRIFGFAVPARQPVLKYEVGAGFIVSTAEDLARYAIAMKNNAAGLLSQTSFSQMFNPGLGSYGWGWNITRDGAKINHGGANETFRTDLNIYPRRDLAFVLLVNHGHLTDHYISSSQLTAGVEAILLGNPPAPVSEGWSVQWPGWGIGILVLGLIILSIRNFSALFNGWIERARLMPPAKKAFDVAISFIIPTVILIIVVTQMKAFFDYRFNLLTSLANLPRVLPDIFFLMLVGSLPDYIQGVIKLVWVAAGRTRPA